MPPTQMNVKLGSVTKRCAVSYHGAQPALINLVNFGSSHESSNHREATYYPFSWQSFHTVFSSQQTPQSHNNQSQQQQIKQRSAAISPIVYGYINGQPARVLIDSGASSNFISATFAQKHSLRATQQPSLPVTFADGRAAPDGGVINLLLLLLFKACEIQVPTVQEQVGLQCSTPAWRGRHPWASMAN